MTDYNDVYRHSRAKHNKLDNIDVLLYEKKPIITTQDIDTGYITRYFVSRMADTVMEIFEVDRQRYLTAQQYAIFTTVQLIWKITGIEDDDPSTRIKGIVNANKRSVETAVITMPGLKYKLTNLTEYAQST